uniref:Odorant receptor n=1 Tax=Aulacocentrum confusum TaxID=2767324 RepID=A0A7G8Z938_9HYME|nr:olfactory receptor 19 [Aulacocentrum confusum]
MYPAKTTKQSIVFDKKLMSEYLAYRDSTKRLASVAGLWPRENPSHFYRSLPYVSVLISLGMVFGIAGYVRQHLNSVALITKGMSVMTSFLSVALKVVCIMSHRQELIQLHQMLDGHFWTLLNDVKLSRVVLNRVAAFRYLSNLLTTFLVLASVTYVVIPIVYVIQQHHHQVQPVKYILIFPGVYPWKIPANGLVYRLHYTFETAANVCLTCVTAGADSLFTLYVFQMMGQLREMAYQISHLDYERDDAKRVIRNCVLRHETLIKSRDILDKIYGPVVLWVMLTNAVVLCSVMFQFTQMKHISVFRVTFLTAYTMLKLTQTFMYSWAGSCLIEQNEDYKTAVYSSKWYKNKQFMVSILIMLSPKALSLTACKFSTVSIDIFSMVLNTAASYFFLLQTVHDG